MTILNVDSKTLAKNITLDIRVTGAGLMRARFWLAAIILRFGAWVAGTCVSIQVNTGSDTRGTVYDKNGVPVRMSLDDPALDHSEAMRLDILLDGVEQSEVLAFDCEEGWIRRLVIRNNDVVLDGKGGLVQETVTGNVTTRWKVAP